MLLEGIFPALTTPFYPDGQIYLRKLEQNVARYSLTSVAGFVVLGSTGEAVMLSDEESREVLHTARQATAAEKVLLAGVGRESVAETLRLAEFAAKEQYDAVLVRTPNFYEPLMPEAAMLNYYRLIADRSPLPVVIYSIPKFTHYDIPVSLVAELANHPNIIGIKDSSGSVERVRAVVSATSEVRKRTVTVTPIFEAVTARMLAVGEEVSGSFVSAEQLGQGSTVLAAAPPRARMATRTREVGFQVLSGAAETTLESLQAGSSGAVLAMGACAPQSCQEIYTAWKDRDPVLALGKQERLSVASGRVAGTLGIAGVKYACELNGYYGGRPRLPLLPLTAAEKAEVEVLMADMRS
ncbi:MAG TPA: dihydrodipicolinate synthase family protein [Acidisarcina sp.]|nr:dihydrodipicolinate synthase family protein [Acidisarcina sp.]